MLLIWRQEGHPVYINMLHHQQSSKVLWNTYGWPSLQSVSQVRVAFAAVVTALHCEWSCARENISVRDMPVSEEMWSSQVVLGCPLERLQEASRGYLPPEAQQIERMVDAGTSRLNLVMRLNNPNRRARTMLMILSKPDVTATVTFRMKSFHLIERILHWYRHMECLDLSPHGFVECPCLRAIK